MSYLIHKTLQTIEEALLHYNLQENQIDRFYRSGNVLIIDTPKKVYFKTINLEFQEQIKQKIKSVHK